MESVTYKDYIYSGIISIPPENHEPFTKNGSTVDQSWDFSKSEIKEWIDDNCSEEWTYQYLTTENKDGTFPIKVFFSDEADAMAFKLKWE